MILQKKKNKPIIYVEYCRSCETHNWCTHHEQAKYYDTFNKFSDLVGKEFPEIDVVGNMVPSHYIPFKINENKYIDSNTNKYVLFPQIGSFEIYFNGETIFSKKQTNTWPKFYNVIDSVGKKLYGEQNELQFLEKSPVKEKSPQKEKSPYKEKTSVSKGSPQKNDKKTEKMQNNQSFLSRNDKMSTFYKEKPNVFTLTDHFKLYNKDKYKYDKENKKQTKTSNSISKTSLASEVDISSDNQDKSKQSNNSLYRISQYKIDKSEENKIKSLLKNNGYYLKQKGKKEMIINLDSIEEQNLPQYDNNASFDKKQKRVSPNTTNKLKQFDDELSELEYKFKNIEDKVNHIKIKKKEFQHPPTNLEQKSKIKNIIQRIKKQEKKISRQDQKAKELMNDLSRIKQQNKLIQNRHHKIDDYIYATEQQKNQQLHRIYGQWKLIKNNKPNKKYFSKKRDRNDEFQSSDQSSSENDNNQDEASRDSNDFLQAMKHKYFGSHNEIKQRLQERANQVKLQKNSKYSSIEQNKKGSQSGIARGLTTQNFFKGKKKNQIGSEKQKYLSQFDREEARLSKKAKKLQNGIQFKKKDNKISLPKKLNQIKLEATPSENKPNKRLNTQKQQPASERIKKSHRFESEDQKTFGNIRQQSVPYFNRNLEEQKNNLAKKTKQNTTHKQKHDNVIRFTKKSKKQRQQNISGEESQIIQNFKRQEEQRNMSIKRQQQQQRSNNINIKKVNKKGIKEQNQKKSPTTKIEKNGKKNSVKIQQSHDLHLLNPAIANKGIKNKKQWRQSFNQQQMQSSQISKNSGKIKSQKLALGKYQMVKQSNKESRVKKVNQGSRIKQISHESRIKQSKENKIKSMNSKSIAKQDNHKSRVKQANNKSEVKQISSKSRVKKTNDKSRVKQINNQNRIKSTSKQSKVRSKYSQKQKSQHSRFASSEQQQMEEQSLIESDEIASSKGSVSSQNDRNEQNQIQQSLQKSKIKTVKLEIAKNQSMISKKSKINKSVLKENESQHQEEQNNINNQKNEVQSSANESQQQGKESREDKEEKDQFENKKNVESNEDKEDKEQEGEKEQTFTYKNYVKQIDEDGEQKKLSVDSDQKYQNKNEQDNKQGQNFAVRDTKKDNQPEQSKQKSLKKNKQQSQKQQLLKGAVIVNNTSHIKSVRQSKSQREEPQNSSERHATETSKRQSIEEQGKVILKKQKKFNSKVKQSSLKSSKLQQHQKDNVYSQPIQSKYRSVGIQKELQIDACIQTQYREDNINGLGASLHHLQAPKSVRTVRKNSIFKDEQKMNKTSENNFLQQSIKRKQSKFKSNQNQAQILRAKILSQLYGAETARQSLKFQKFIDNSLDETQILELIGHSSIQQTIKKPISQIYEKNSEETPQLFNTKSLDVQSIKFNEQNLKSFRKIIKILCDKNQYLLIRLFQNPRNQKLEIGNYYGVWICDNYQWECVIVDDLIEVDENNVPLHCFHKGGQYWVNILEKVLAKVLGGYDKLAEVECCTLFTMLTGSNTLNFSVKEDPTKNGKFVKYISECENKNFIIHAEKICKNMHEVERKGKDNAVYYILSAKKINDDQTLIEISEDNKESFWIKLSKFCQQFQTAEILQLRINHNFTSLNISKENQEQLSIIELQFQYDSFGCITLTYLQGKGPLKVYLYRQQKSQMLKLVGQAKQKNRKQLFFDCYFAEGNKYYVFLQTEGKGSRVAYFGESKPIARIKEHIHSDDLKNDFTEYLPVSKVHKENQAPRKPFNFNETGFSYRSKDERIQKLRNNFVEYLVKSKNSNIFSSLSLNAKEEEQK